MLIFKVVLFVLSSGFFYESLRANTLVTFLAGMFAVFASYFLLSDVWELYKAGQHPRYESTVVTLDLPSIPKIVQPLTSANESSSRAIRSLPSAKTTGTLTTYRSWDEARILCGFGNAVVIEEGKEYGCR